LSHPAAAEAAAPKIGGYLAEVRIIRNKIQRSCEQLEA
jgi:hypothetical protein